MLVCDSPTFSHYVFRKGPSITIFSPWSYAAGTGKPAKTLQTEELVPAVELQHELALHPVMGNEWPQVFSRKLQSAPIDTNHGNGLCRPLIIMQVTLRRQIQVKTDLIHISGYLLDT